MADHGAPPAFEILEHTADIGLRAHGHSLEELFENAAWGLAEILDVDRRAQVIEAAAVDGGTPASLRLRDREAGTPPAYAPPPSPISLAAPDVEALLVEWMNELILLTEEGKACVADVDVESVTANSLEAGVELVECDPLPEGTDLKAATYHQLSVRRGDEGWQATVYFDV